MGYFPIDSLLVLNPDLILKTILIWAAGQKLRYRTLAGSNYRNQTSQLLYVVHGFFPQKKGPILALERELLGVTENE